jgi:hypothetical protein
MPTMMDVVVEELWMRAETNFENKNIGRLKRLLFCRDLRSMCKIFLPKS